MPSTFTDRIDGLTTSVAVKAPCDCATTAAITLSGLQSVDGLFVVDTLPQMRVLVKNQSDPTENGIYNPSVGAWSRTLDFDGARDAVDGTIVYVKQGTALGLWRASATNPVLFGSSSITFSALIVSAAFSIITPFTFGAVANGVADDSTALAMAFSQVGKLIFVPPGTYKYTANLVPTCAGIVGLGDENSVILKPTAAVTKGLSIGGASYPTVFRDFQVDMSNLLGTSVGVFFGDASSVAVNVSGLRVIGGASTSFGIRIGDVLKSRFEKITTGSCGTGLLVQKVSSGFPTTVAIDTAVFTGSANQGAKIVDGDEVVFTNADFESSQKEGALVLPSSEVRVTFGDGCWFEDNWRSIATGVGREAKYQLSFGDGSTSLAGKIIKSIVRGASFRWDTGFAKAILIDGGGGNVNVDVYSPKFVSNPDNATIKVINSGVGQAFGTLSQGSWRDTVSDTGNLFVLPSGTNPRTWNPTVVPNAGAITGQSNVTTSYVFQGRSSTKINLRISGTLTGTPTSMKLDLPVGLTPTVASHFMCQLFLGAGVTPAAGFLTVETDGFIYIAKADGTAFAAAAVVFTGTVEYDW